MTTATEHAPMTLRAVDAPATLDVAAAYREHAPMVFRLARRFGVPAEAVDDVVHEVFVVVHRRRGDYDGRASVRAWLAGITRRVAADDRRRRQTARRKLAVVPEPAPTPSLEENVARKRAADLVRAFLDGLPEDQRHVFVLADIEGLTAPEIASALSVKLPTVYSRLRLAREKFQRVARRHEAQRDRTRPKGGVDDAR